MLKSFDLKIIKLTFFIFGLFFISDSLANELVPEGQVNHINRKNFTKMVNLDDRKMSLIIGEASVNTDYGEFYIQAEDDRVSGLLLSLPVNITSIEKTVKIMVEDLTIKTITGGVSWGDTDGVAGSGPGIFTAFSHLTDIIHINMTAPVEIEAKYGAIPGLDDGEVTYLEQRIPGMEIEFKTFTKVLALTDKMVTDEEIGPYTKGDIDPYNGLVLSPDNDPNYLLDNPDTSAIDPALKFAESHEILGTYHKCGAVMMTSGGLDKNGIPQSDNPAKVYVFVH